MKAPFPYFGGKSTIANKIWAALGNPKHYIEPFFGSGAVLLSRKNYDPSQSVESVNDKDCHIANVWRSLQQAPDEVAKWCDWPVNHCDLNARRRRLLAMQGEMAANLVADIDYCDPKMAGFWIWAASCWIGSGLTRINGIPHISDGGLGVHAMGKRPNISHGGMGVHAMGKRPNISHGGMGVQESYNTNIYDHFRKLSERLRYVRVVCGDWSQVCGGNWQDKIGDVGIFFDPPYGVSDRDTTLYSVDSVDVAHEVRAWCIERGAIPTYRIVLAGYEEHNELLEHGWTCEKWKAQGGYSTSKNGNRSREVLYYSPHCYKSQRQKQLFG